MSNSLAVVPPHNAPNVSTLGGVMSQTPFITALESLVGPAVKQYQYNPNTVRNELATVLQNHEGRAEILAVFLDNLYPETENAWIFKLFRLQRFGDMNYETWAYSFESGIAEERPSQSSFPSGGWKQTKISGQLKRFQYGVKALIDGLKDPKGQMVWYAQTVQCAQSFIRALESLALTALINARAWYLKVWAESADYTVNLSTRATLESETFDAFHRYENAIGVVLNLVNDAFSQSQRGNVTAVIIPQGLRTLIAFDPTKTEMYRRGPDAQLFADLGADAPSLQGTLLNTDVKVYTASPIRASAQLVHHDAMKRKMEFGGYTGIGVYGMPHTNPSNYKSSCTVPGVFSFHDNTFVDVTLPYVLKATGRFDPAGNLSAAHGRLAREVNTIAESNGLSVVNGMIDMFLYDAEKTAGPAPVVGVWGHCADWALVPEAIKWHAETMKTHLLTKVLDAKEKENFNTGERVKEDALNMSLTDEVVAWFRAIQPPAGNGNLSKGHYTGGPDLPVLQAPPANASAAVQAAYAPFLPIITRGNFGPRGVASSSAGLLVLSLLDSSKYPYIAPMYFDVAKNYWAAAKKLYYEFLDIYTIDHPLLNPAFCPVQFATNEDSDWAREYKSMITFAHNVLDGNPTVVQLADASSLVNGIRGDALAAPYTVYENLREFTDPLARDAFMTNDTIKVIHDKFNSGPMAQAYRSYLSEQSRGTAPVVPAATVADPFNYFLEHEVEARFAKAGADKDFKNSWIFGRLMNHIITATNSATPYTFQKARLDGLISDTNFKGYADATRGTFGTKTVQVGGVNTEVPLRGFYTTRLVVSPERLHEYLSDNQNQLRDTIRLASPLNQSIPLQNISQFDEQMRRAQAGTPVDLAANTMSSMAKQKSTQPRKPFALSSRGAPFTSFSAFGVEVSTDAYGRSFTKTNENLVGRLEAAMKKKDSFLRMSAIMQLTSQIREQTFLNWWERDVYFLVDITLVRSRRTYETVCAIWLAIDKEVGIAAWALADVRRGIDPIKKILHDNWTCYLGVIVTDPSRVIVTPDLAITDYKRGETIDIVWPPSHAHLRDPSQTDPSMYCIMAPGFSCVGANRKLGKIWDITGRFKHQITQYKEEKGRPGQPFAATNAPLHPSSFMTCMQFQFDKHLEGALGPVGMMSNRTRKNTLVGEEKVQIVTPMGVTYTMASDLMGMDVYPGVASKRKAGKPAQIVSTFAASTSAQITN